MQYLNIERCQKGLRATNCGIPRILTIVHFPGKNKCLSKNLAWLHFMSVACMLTHNLSRGVAPKLYGHCDTRNDTVTQIDKGLCCASTLKK